jgi:hypothetical protein
MLLIYDQAISELLTQGYIETAWGQYKCQPLKYRLAVLCPSQQIECEMQIKGM